MSADNQKKKTIHFNMGLGTNKLIMKFFEDANDGRSFSSFTKDILHAQAVEYFTKTEAVLEQPVFQKVSHDIDSNNCVRVKDTEKPAPSIKATVEDQNREEAAESTKTDIASAAASMFGPSL